MIEKNMELHDALARSEALNLHLQKEVNIVKAISRIFFATWRIDLLMDTVEPVVEIDEHDYLFDDKDPGVEEYISVILDRAEEEYKEELARGLQLDNLQSNLRYQDHLYYEYRTKNVGWVRLNIIAVERDVFSDVMIVLFGWRNINEERWRDAEHKRKLKQANQSMEKALKAAKRASSAKSDFLSRMSHDMRTPMNVIMGMAGIGLKSLDDKERMKDALEKISAAGKQLNLLINDVLDMSQIESGKVQLQREHSDLRKIMDNILSGIYVLAKEKHINIIYDDILCMHHYVYCSHIHMQRIVYNVLSNAVKYNMPGGEVRIIVDEKPLAESDKESVFVLTVSDNGIGMSQEFIDNRLYKPFARDENTQGIEGTGLGMSIVKEVVRLMGGDIQVESALGKGTVVRIYLPLELAPKLEEKNLKNRTANEKHLAGKRILLVDDNEVNLEIAEFLLSNYGAECETAVNGQLAVDKFVENGAGYYDMIIMDMSMPVMDGISATKIIRSQKQADAADIPILAMTANAFVEDRIRCRDAGMNDHISKPVNVEHMLKIIDMYI